MRAGGIRPIRQMGVNGLFSFLQRWTHHASIEHQRIGIDIFFFLHRSKGDVERLHTMLEPYWVAKEVHAVFDGKAHTKEREKELGERRESRKRARTILECLEDAPLSDLDVHSQALIHRKKKELVEQAWAPSKDYVEQAVSWLHSKGAIIHRPEEEADSYLVPLEQDGIIDIIVSNDSDLIVRGAKRLLRPLRSEGYLDTVYMREELGFSMRQWTDFLALCRDMRTPDVVLAYSLMSVYKRKEVAMIRWEEVNGLPLLR